MVRTMTSTESKARAQIGDLITVQGRRVHVRQDGPYDGKPVLLLHGFEGSVHWWDAVTPLLADTYRVIRVDLLGFGCTGGEAGFGQDGQGSMLAAVLAELGVAKVAVCGHSWGADAALAVAARSPRITEIIILDQAPDLSYLHVPAITPVLTLGPIARFIQRFAPETMVRQALREGFAPGFNTSGIVPSMRQMIQDHRAMSWRAYREVSTVRRRALAADPLDRQLRRLALPTLVIHGRLDSMYDWAITRDRYTTAGARFELIDTAGHSPNVETPQRFTEILREFLVAPTAPTPIGD